MLCAPMQGLERETSHELLWQPSAESWSEEPSPRVPSAADGAGGSANPLAMAPGDIPGSRVASEAGIGPVAGAKPLPPSQTGKQSSGQQAGVLSVPSPSGTHGMANAAQLQLLQLLPQPGGSGGGAAPSLPMQLNNPAALQALQAIFPQLGLQGPLQSQPSGGGSDSSKRVSGAQQAGSQPQLQLPAGLPATMLMGPGGMSPVVGLPGTVFCTLARMPGLSSYHVTSAIHTASSKPLLFAEVQA